MCYDLDLSFLLTPSPSSTLSLIVTDAHILSYFSVFYMDLFDEVFVFEFNGQSRVATMCIVSHMKCHVMSCDLGKVFPCLGRSMCVL